MPCSPRSPWLLGLGASLALAFAAAPASADPRGGADASQARHGRGERDVHAPSPESHVHEDAGNGPAWSRPFGWNFGWGFGSDAHWDSHWELATDWHTQFCEALDTELSQHEGWGWGRAWFQRCGCGQGGETPPPDPDPLGPPPDHTLLDETGSPMADLGSVDVDSSVIRVPYATSFADPVVIVGPPTAHDADPGVAQVLSVDPQGFRVRFSEWSYLDGSHAPETISYLVMTPGRHLMPDGSEWEVGVMDVSGNGVWNTATFTAPFAQPPLVFLTAQTANEADPVVVRARDVTSSGFQAALFEEEGSDGTHGAERVGYVAVVAPQGSGRMDATAGSLPYLLRSVVADDRHVPVLSASLWLEEEASLDDELTHADETLAFLAIGPNVFAQDLSSADLDTAAVRRAAPEYGPVMEWGTLSDVGDAWQTVPLARSYTDPVVVVGPMSVDDPAPGLLRVRNVSTDSFEVRAESWAYIARPHGPERTFYLVVDPGVQSLDGLVVQAGHLDSSLVLNDAQETVSLALPYTEVPGVFASVMTENGTQPVMVRVVGRTTDGFRMALQPEEAYTGSLPSERLGWVSIQVGRVVTTDGRVVSVFDTAVDSAAVDVPFGETLRGRFPTLLGSISTALGIDPVVLRYWDLTPDGVTLQLDEEQSANPETNHRSEDVSVLVAE